MRLLSSLFFLSTLLSLPTTAVAQQPPERDPRAVALMSRSLAFMGAGSIAISPRAGITLVASGTYTQFSGPTPTSYPFRMKLLGLDQIRWEVDRPEGSHVTLIRQGAGWSLTPGGTVRLPVGALFGRQLEVVPVLSIAHWLNSGNVSIRDGGTEDVEGRSLRLFLIHSGYAGRASPDFHSAYEQMSRCELYLDSQTLLPARLRYYEHPRDWRVNIPMDLVFSNYQVTGGVLMPTTVTRYLRGQKVDEYQFEAVAFNAAVDAREFGVR